MSGHSRSLIVPWEQFLKEKSGPQIKSMKQKRKKRRKQNKLNSEGEKSRSLYETRKSTRCDNNKRQKSIARRRDRKNREKKGSQENSGRTHSRSTHLSPAFFFDQPRSKRSQINECKDFDERYNRNRLAHSIYYNSHASYSHKNCNGTRKSRGKRKKRNQKKLQDRRENYHIKVLIREKRGHPRDHRELKDHYCKIGSSNALYSLILRDTNRSKSKGYLRQKMAVKTMKPIVNTDCTRLQIKTPNLLRGNTEYADKQILNPQTDLMTTSHRKINRQMMRKKPGSKLLWSDEIKITRQEASHQNSGEFFQIMSTHNSNQKKYLPLNIREKEKSNISLDNKAMLANNGNQKEKFLKSLTMFGCLSKVYKSTDREITPQKQILNSSTEFCFQGHLHSHSKVTEAVLSRVPSQEKWTDDSTEVSNPNTNRNDGDIKILPQDEQSKFFKITPEQNFYTWSDGDSEIYAGDFSDGYEIAKRYALPDTAGRQDSFSSLNSLSGSASDLGSWGVPDWWYESCNEQEEISRPTVKEQRYDDPNDDSIAPDHDKTRKITGRKPAQSCKHEVSMGTPSSRCSNELSECSQSFGDEYPK